jgi:hypothetical protein
MIAFFELGIAQHQRQHRADPGRGQGRQDRDRVYIALVEHAQHDIHRQQRRCDQHRLVVERLLKGPGGSLETGVNAARDMQLGHRAIDGGRGLAERDSRL